MKILENIAYSAQSELQKMDLFLPDEAPKAFVVWFHGGGIEGGTRRDNAFLAEPLTKRGIALSLPSYRLFPTAKYPEFLIDAANAVKKTLEIRDETAARHPGNAIRVIAGGSSAGAYLTMMLCFARRYLAEVGLVPEKIDGWLFDAGQPTTHFNVLKYCGDDPKRIVADEAAPIYHVTDARPGKPVSILCADQDMPSRRTQNLLFVETLLRFGWNPSLVEMETLNGYTHCGYDAAFDADGRYVLENRILRLLDRINRI